LHQWPPQCFCFIKACSRADNAFRCLASHAVEAEFSRLGETRKMDEMSELGVVRLGMELRIRKEESAATDVVLSVQD
jgi:hypothetical protein